jgi:hypothetical protein
LAKPLRQWTLPVVTQLKVAPARGYSVTVWKQSKKGGLRMTEIPDDQFLEYVGDITGQFAELCSDKWPVIAAALSLVAALIRDAKAKTPAQKNAA